VQYAAENTQVGEISAAHRSEVENRIAKSDYMREFAPHNTSINVYRISDVSWY